MSALDSGPQLLVVLAEFAFRLMLRPIEFSFRVKRLPATLNFDVGTTSARGFFKKLLLIDVTP
jgi:hypothetical protein